MTKAAKDRPPDADPILSEAPTVTIAGTEYPLRRLGLRDVFRVSRILGRGVGLIGDVTTLTVTQLAQVLILSMNANEEEVLRLLADVIGVDRVDLEDEERFPMEAFIDILAGLAKHQDILAFIARLQTLASRLPEMQTRSGEASVFSGDTEAGPEPATTNS